VRDAAGNRFEELFRAHFDAVLRYASSRAPDDAAKDAVAQTFLVAWRRIDEIPDRALPWLLAVTRRTLADQRRSAQRLERLRGRLRAPAPAADIAAEASERDVVLSAFARLRPADREVLQLVAWDGLDPADAGAMLGCTAATFSVRLFRARRRFEAELEAEDGQTERRSAVDLEAR